MENLKNHELVSDQRLQLLDSESFTSQLGANVLRLLVKEVVVGDDEIKVFLVRCFMIRIKYLVINMGKKYAYKSPFQERDYSWLILKEKALNKF